MRNILMIICALGLLSKATAQITITASDMPVAGDTLRYSFSSPTGSGISPADSGAGVTWTYSLTPLRQAVDSYQTALAVNILYVATVGPTAYGYKVADSFPIPLPTVSIHNIYTFFEKKAGPPARYEAKAFAASISGLPTAFNYSTPDVWYFFPLTYGSYDSSNYALNITVPVLGSIKQQGYRKTRVDGWGTITTPYFPLGVSAIRVRSEIHEIDSVSLLSVAFPRNTVEYKWLTNGDHYPALWVTSNLTPAGETISSVRYRDDARAGTPTDTVSAVGAARQQYASLQAWPNPATNIVHLELPAGWQTFDIELYDMTSKLVGAYRNRKELDITTLPAGQYLCRVVSGRAEGYVMVTKN